MVPPPPAGDRARKPAQKSARKAAQPAPSSVQQRPDPTEVSHWRPLYALLAAMDDEIAALYTERGVTGIRPRFTRPLIRLGREGPMTIRALADALDRTHSAMSQTVAVLRREGFVRSTPGADARTREVAVTARAREVLPFLEAEWRATEQAVADLEAEIPYPLSQVVHDLEAALSRRPFKDRIAAHLDAAALDEGAGEDGAR